MTPEVWRGSTRTLIVRPRKKCFFVCLPLAILFKNTFCLFDLQSGRQDVDPEVLGGDDGEPRPQHDPLQVPQPGEERGRDLRL